MFNNIFVQSGRILFVLVAFFAILPPCVAAEPGGDNSGNDNPAEESIVRIPVEEDDDSFGLEFIIRPIGYVLRKEGRTEIFLEEKYEPGLMGLEPGMHVMIFWWFDKNDTPEDRRVIQVHPRGNKANPLQGVFATRSPRRPNLLALTCCKVMAVRGNVLEIDKIDAFSGTPVLDIKPYVAVFDTPGE